MNIENGDERLLRAERERDEARAEVAAEKDARIYWWKNSEAMARRAEKAEAEVASLRKNWQPVAEALSGGGDFSVLESPVDYVVELQDERDKAEAEVARLRERAERAEQERDKVTRQLNSERADHVRIAVALGTFYESDYSGPVRAPVDVVVREIEALVKDRTAADRLRSLDQAVLAYRRKERALLGLPDGALEEDHLQAIARLRASQNERAIAELVWVAGMMHGGVFDPAWTKARVGIGDRIAALRAEAQAAPAKEPVPAEPAAPQGPSVERLQESYRTLDAQLGSFDHAAIAALRIAVRLLLDAEIARRGGAK